MLNGNQDHRKCVEGGVVVDILLKQLKECNIQSICQHEKMYTLRQNVVLEVISKPYHERNL